MHIAVFVPQNGVIDVITSTFRTFHTANEFLNSFGKSSIFEVEYIGMKDYISTNQGECVIKTNKLLKDLSNTDLLIIPPTSGDLTIGLNNNLAAIPYFKKLYQRGTSLASLCIGAFLLAETGLLNGKKCSTHWAYLNEFKERYPSVELVDGTIITEHENIYSSGGANSYWNLLLHLVEKFSDRETAIMISKYFALDIGRENQSQFMIFKGQRNHNDHEIHKVQDFIEQNYCDKISIDILAKLINTGRRTFERKFKQATNNTPALYLQRVRIEAAKKHFEAARRNVSDIMFDVGYTDTKAFRDTFKKVTGLTPIEYRNKFGKIEYKVSNNFISS